MLFARPILGLESFDEICSKISHFGDGILLFGGVLDSRVPGRRAIGSRWERQEHDGS